MNVLNLVSDFHCSRSRAIMVELTPQERDLVADANAEFPDQASSQTYAKLHEQLDALLEKCFKQNKYLVIKVTP